MAVKPVVPRAIADRDLGEAIRYYVKEAGPDVALRFNDAVQAVYRAIAEHPELGPPRDDGEPRLAGMRSRSVKRFPYLVFYIDRPEHVDVIPVLHERRDLVTMLRAPVR